MWWVVLELNIAAMSASVVFLDEVGQLGVAAMQSVRVLARIQHLDVHAEVAILEHGGYKVFRPESPAPGAVLS